MSKITISLADDGQRKFVHDEDIRHFNESKTPFEDLARSMLDDVLRTANESLGPEGRRCMRADEYAVLKGSTEQMRPAFYALMNGFIEQFREILPNSVDHAYKQIWILIAPAFSIGAYGTITEGNAKFFEAMIAAETACNQAEKARKKRAEKSKPHQEALKNAIKVVAGKEQPYDSEKYAESICGEVRQLLPDSYKGGGECSDNSAGHKGHSSRVRQ